MGKVTSCPKIFSFASIFFVSSVFASTGATKMRCFQSPGDQECINEAYEGTEEIFAEIFRLSLKEDYPYLGDFEFDIESDDESFDLEKSILSAKLFGHEDEVRITQGWIRSFYGVAETKGASSRTVDFPFRAYLVWGKETSTQPLPQTSASIQDHIKSWSTIDFEADSKESAHIGYLKLNGRYWAIHYFVPKGALPESTLVTVRRRGCTERNWSSRWASGLEKCNERGHWYTATSGHHACGIPYSPWIWESTPKDLYQTDKYGDKRMQELALKGWNNRDKFKWCVYERDSPEFDEPLAIWQDGKFLKKGETLELSANIGWLEDDDKFHTLLDDIRFKVVPLSSIEAYIDPATLNLLDATTNDRGIEDIVFDSAFVNPKAQKGKFKIRLPFKSFGSL